MEIDSDEVSNEEFNSKMNTSFNQFSILSEKSLKLENETKQLKFHLK